MTRLKQAAETTVYIGGRRRVYFRPVVVEQSAGGRRLDFAVIEANRDDFDDKPFFDKLKFNSLPNSSVEIVVTSGGKSKVIHWGRLVAHSIDWSADGDSLRLESRTEPHHFGSPLQAAATFAPHLPAASFLLTQDPVIFNPEIDGQAVGNNWLGYLIPADQALPRAGTTAAVTRLGGSYWTLPEAVRYLCELLNETETYIRNPALRDLTRVLPSDTGLLRNQEQPYGEYLPQQLDALLEPFGYSWRVEYVGRGRRRIAVFALGNGRRKTLRVQQPGTAASVADTHTDRVQIGLDISRTLTNSVLVLGDYETVEGTFELKPAWESTYDAHTFSDLALDKKTEWEADPKLADVWRKWVLNEAGDYDRWPEFNFGPLWPRTSYTPRRRPFGPCVATNLGDNMPVGGRHGMVVEWWDDRASAWKLVEELAAGGQWQPLEREAGIYFTGQLPPHQLYSQGVTVAKVRVTASLRSDQRLIGRAVNPFSLCTDAREAVIDAGDKYKWRRILTTSRHYSRVTTGALGSSAVNDTVKANDFAARVLQQWRAGTLSGEVYLLGLDHFGYDVGDSIVGTTPRSVNFRVTSDADIARYPSVLAIRYDISSQATMLMLDGSPFGSGSVATVDTVTPKVRKL